MARKFYITTSIPYTNASPHIGFALEIIQADVLARYHRGLEEDVFFSTGTDEHGLKTLRAAEAAGKTTTEFADELSGKFKDLAEKLNISNSDFIRTTDEARHKPAVYKLWEQYEKKGDIYKKKYKGLYCPGCEAFKTEKEIIDGKCVIHQKPIEEVQEENYFFKLSKYLPEIKKLIENDKLKIIPESKKNEVLGMIEQGMEDLSVSRSKEKYWGWPIPGDDSQNLYVWLDALPNYISVLGYGTDEKNFKKYWPVDVHCIGKDIVKFHAIYWPAMLLSAGIELPKSIFVHGFINVAGQKMSKSLGNVVNPFELVEKYGTDAVRHFLVQHIHPFEDGDFTIERFEERYNSDLADGIGNLVARIIKLAQMYLEEKLEGRVKKEEGEGQYKTDYEETLEKYRFDQASDYIFREISRIDKNISEEKSFEVMKNGDQEKGKELIRGYVQELYRIARLLGPFMPQTSEKIIEQLKTKESQPLFPRLNVG